MVKTVSTRRLLLLAAAFVALAAAAGFAQGRQDVQAQSSTAYRGVLVLAVEAGSPANTAGLVRGDIILTFAGKDVNTTADLTQAVAAQKPGDSASVRLLHGDVDRTISVKLANRGGLAFFGVAVAPQGGGPLATLPPMMRQFRGLRQFGQMVPGMRGFGQRGLGGAWVGAVTADGPAAKAGIKTGDIIEAVDGTAVDATHDLASLVAAKKPGDQVTLVVRTAAEQVSSVPVTLGESPDTKGKAWLGLSYSLAGAVPQTPTVPGVTAGIVVAQVVADSPAAKAGIAQGDIITSIDGVSISTPRDVTATVSSHKPGDSLTLTVYRAAAGKSSDVSVTLGASPSAAGQAWLGISMRAYNMMRGPRFSQRPGDQDRAPAGQQQPTAPSTATM